MNRTAEAAVISSIMQNVLEITATSMEELPDDIQHTKERKPDVLKKVTDISLVGRTTPSHGTVSSPDIVRKQNPELSYS